MTSRAPPRIATWLLERLASDSLSAALIGDLAEQFAAGRSRAWFWRQAAGGLALELLRLVRTDALTFAAAVVAGCAFSFLWHLLSSIALQPLYGNLPGVSPHPRTPERLLRFAGLLASAASNGALAFLSVWLVTRIHRTYRRALLVAFVIALTAEHLPGIVRLAIELARDSRVAVSLSIEVVMAALQAVFTLVAGLWSLRTRRFADMDRRTRFVSIMVVAQVVLASVLYSAWRVGALSYSRPEGYLLDAAEFASAGYLAFLLWRPSSAAQITKRPRTLASGGRRSAATALR